MWDGVEERFRKKLAIWKRRFISKGGRLTLIQSTLSNLPIYSMSLFHLPKGVKSRLEKIQRGFLWVGGNLERKIHLVSWDAVCLGKEKGGLRIRSLATLNKALLGKWAWRFAVEDNPMWKKVITLKYQIEEGVWFTKEPRGSFGRDISNAARKLRQDCYFVNGDGSRVKFCFDSWCGERPLRVMFPSLYDLAGSKRAMVVEVWDITIGEGTWNPRSTRSINDWEMDEVQNFINLISRKKLISCKETDCFGRGIKMESSQ